MRGDPGGVIPVAAEGGLVPWSRVAWVAGGLALLRLVLLLAVAGRYGYFIDEFYYLACARHMAWGYVDHPPFSIACLRLWTVLFGDGLVAIRIFPALCGAATLLLTGALARAFGADRFGTLLACLAALASPVLLGLDHFFSMNSLESLLWTASLLVFVLILREGAPRLWLLLGLLLGAGLLNKIGTLWLGSGLFLGLVLTRYRARLRSPWPWIGGALAAVLFLPHVLWQVRHDWPTVEFVRNATREKYASITRLDFVLSLVFEFHPLTLPVWVAGAYSSLAGRLARTFRPVGIAWLTIFAILFAMGHGRPHYLSGSMPAMYAAGGAVLGAAFRGSRRAWLRPLSAGLLGIGFLIGLPLGLPVLSPDAYVRYAQRIGVVQRSAEGQRLEGMPQHIADQIGWPELVEATAAACDRLSPEERAWACIFAPFYGAAGAIERLGRGRGLPPVICGHNSYWYWGLGKCDGSVVVHLGGSRERLFQEFASVEPAGRVPVTRGMPYRNGMPIWICRGLRGSMGDAWELAKTFH